MFNIWKLDILLLVLVDGMKKFGKNCLTIDCLVSIEERRHHNGTTNNSIITRPKKSSKKPPNWGRGRNLINPFEDHLKLTLKKRPPLKLPHHHPFTKDRHLKLFPIQALISFHTYHQNSHIMVCFMVAFLWWFFKVVYMPFQWLCKWFRWFKIQETHLT